MNELERNLRIYINQLKEDNNLRSKIMQDRLFKYEEHELILRTQYNNTLQIIIDLERLL
jgi:DNA-binding HxlR family transcriptional regulator